MKNDGKYIGVNHTNEFRFSRIDSSFPREFVNEEVLIEMGIGDIVPCVIGDVSDAYKILKEELMKNGDITDIEGICECILNTVQRYFGNFDNISTRMKFYPDTDLIAYKKLEVGKVSDLKGKNAAMCVERAMLSQNLLKHLDINSFYKASGIKKNGKSEAHAYNLIGYGDKYYIFDSTIPTVVDGKISPLVAEIPRDVFELITRKESDVGCSVSISHYNPLKDVNIDIVYDSGREEKYDANDVESKKHK